MQHGEPSVGATTEERDDKLDARYREEGWGLLTDQAFAGRLRPRNVESQARDMARWAYEKMKASTALTNQQGTDLIRLEKELANYAGEVARLQPQVIGLKAAMRLHDVEHKRVRLELALERANHAALALRVAECELVLAEHKSAQGGSNPTTLQARKLREWLNPPDTSASSGCCHE